MATLYLVDGTTKEVEPKNKKKGFELNELYKMLGCELIEIVYPRVNNGTIIVCDEEGTYKDNPQINEKATKLFGWGDSYPIVGNALVCKSNEVK